jgi:transposase
MEPGASVAQVALAHGLNANLVHKWRRKAGGGDGVGALVREASAFVAVKLAPNTAAATRDIGIELRRGAVAVNVSWPLAAAAECAGWLRELLK